MGPKAGLEEERRLLWSKNVCVKTKVFKVPEWSLGHSETIFVSVFLQQQVMDCLSPSWF